MPPTARARAASIAGGSGASSDSEQELGLAEPADQQQTAQLDRAGMGGVETIAMGFQRYARRIERLRRPAEIA